MSEKWETVSKGSQGPKKPHTNGKASNGVKQAKAPGPKVYTVEDVLPAASVVNSFSSAFNPSPKSPKKGTK